MKVIILLLEAKIDSTGTGVHGVAYQDEIQVLAFQAGECKKICAYQLLHFAADKTLDFYLNLTVDGQLIDQAHILLKRDKISSQFISFPNK